MTRTGLSPEASERRTELVVRILEQIMVDHDFPYQARLAESLGTSSSHLSHIFNRERQAGEGVLRKLGRAFPEWRPAMEQLLLASEQELMEFTVEELERSAL